MLKIRNLVFALSLGPVLSVAWQLPNQAQIPTINGSSCTAGCNSGANTGAPGTTIFSVPRPGNRPGGITTPVTTPGGRIINVPIIFGISPNISTGVSTAGNLIAGSEPIQISAQKTELNASSITVVDARTENTVFISLSPSDQSTVNQVATDTIRNLISTNNGKDIPPVIVLMNGGAGAEDAAVFVTNSLTTAGISPERVQAIVKSLNGLLAGSAPTASLTSSPVAQTTLEKLTFRTKVFKSLSVIAQANKALNVDVNKLNDAIIEYDGIIVESKAEDSKAEDSKAKDSKAEDSQKLYQNDDFTLIGQILKQLRAGIK